MRFRTAFFSLILLFSSAFAFSYTPGFEIGAGSGYVHYGDKKTRSRNSGLGSSNQMILTADALVLFPIEQNMYLSLGGDSTFDARWKGGGHIYLVDYSFLLGFRMYPGLWGFVFSIDYALGRRTDFIDFKNYDNEVDSTEWGNGFRFDLGYDFSVHTNGFAPTLGAAWKSMPRGGSRDNLITVYLKFGKRRP